MAPHVYRACGFAGAARRHEKVSGANVTDPLIDIWVAGQPRTAGSKKPVTSKKTGFTVMLEQTKYARAWRKEVADAARVAWFWKPTEKPVRLHIECYWARPAAHSNRSRRR